MKKILKPVFILCLISLIPLPLLAEEYYHPQSVYRNSIGAGPYAAILDHSKFTQNMEFTGGSIIATIGLTRNFAARFNGYAVNETDINDVSISGAEALLLLGTNFFYKGGNVYIGAGIYSETLEQGSQEFSYRGGEAILGVAYNWSKITMDLYLTFRETNQLTEDYFPANESNIEYGTAGLSLALRF